VNYGSGGQPNKFVNRFLIKPLFISSAITIMIIARIIAHQYWFQKLYSVSVIAISLSRRLELKTVSRKLFGACHELPCTSSFVTQRVSTLRHPNPRIINQNVA
jgi:hypothetical protein